MCCRVFLFAFSTVTDMSFPATSDVTGERFSSASFPVTSTGRRLLEALPRDPRAPRDSALDFGVYTDGFGDCKVNHLAQGRFEVLADGTIHCEIADGVDRLTVVSGVAWSADTRSSDPAFAELIWSRRANISAALLSSPFLRVPATPLGVVRAGRLKVVVEGDVLALYDFDRDSRCHATISL